LAAHSGWPSSKAAIAESNALKAQGSSEKALLSIHGVRESLATLKDNIADMRAQVNDLYRQSLWESQQRRLEAQRLAQAQAVSQNLQAAEGALAAAATLLDMAGDHKAARSAMALANAIDKTEKVATAIVTGAGAAVVGMGYFALAVAVVAIFVAANEPESPFPAIFEALIQIQRQLDDLRETLEIRLNQIDTRLGNLLSHNIMISNAILYNTQELRGQLNRIQEQLERNQQALLNQHLALAEMKLVDDDNTCFRFDGNRRLIDPTKAGFIKCRDIYTDRAVRFSRSSLAPAQVESSPSNPLAAFQRIFPFAENYNELADTIHYQTPSHNTIVNPNTWYSGSTRLLALAGQSPNMWTRLIWLKALRVLPACSWIQ
jgi:hypothetical protein